jgi:hypothetical protein
MVIMAIGVVLLLFDLQESLYEVVYSLSLSSLLRIHDDRNGTVTSYEKHTKKGGSHVCCPSRRVKTGGHLLLQYYLYLTVSKVVE